MTRHEARQSALQALYQIDISHCDVVDAVAFVLEEQKFSDSDLAYIQTLVQGTLAYMNDADSHLKRMMERWSTERVGRVELNVLRLAMYELAYETDVPAASILDEAVRLSKSFSTVTSGKFVNGVLAKVLEEIRPNHVLESNDHRKSDT